jgi:basic amino acid/polyamine antiporter, APA family
MAALFGRVKPIARVLAEGTNERNGLRRSLGPWSLTAMGDRNDHRHRDFRPHRRRFCKPRAAGALNFVRRRRNRQRARRAVLCRGFEQGRPISGSAYTYGTMGELLAWIVGWGLMFEYALGSAAVSVGWSGYFAYILPTLHIN